MVKLLIQPQDGIAALLAAIKKAKKTIEIVIFRFDRAEIRVLAKMMVLRAVLKPKEVPKADEKIVDGMPVDGEDN